MKKKFDDSEQRRKAALADIPHNVGAKAEADRAKFEAMQERIYQAVSDSSEADKIIVETGGRPPPA